MALLRFVLAISLAAAPALAQTIDFGDNSSEWARDGECDDPRFVGDGMAVDLDDVNILADQDDCAMLFSTGQVALANTEPMSQQACAAIDFGGDTSEWANDGECDDPRFDGPGTDSIMIGEDLMSDATDCRRSCMAGEAWLR